MGNAQYKYLTVAEAQQVLGGAAKWNAIQRKLESLIGNGSSLNYSLTASGKGCIDYPLFYHIISRRFEKIPRGLCECIYKAFASDIQQKVDIEQFLCTLAVAFLPAHLSSLHPISHFNTNSSSGVSTAGANLLLARFVFRVYENLGTLERKRVEDMITVAYGERLHGNPQQLATAQQLLDAIFDKRRREISLRDLEQCAAHNIRMDLFISWISYVLQVFVTDASQSKVYLLERKYSSFSESQELMSKYDIPRSVCDAMRGTFVSICESVGNNAELSLAAWLATVSGMQLDPVVSATIMNKSNDNQQEEEEDASGLENYDGSKKVIGKLGSGEDMAIEMVHKKKSKRPRSDTMSSLTSKGGGDEEVEVDADRSERLLMYIRPELATVIFSAKVNTFKGVWRFLDFAEFCAIYGRAGTIVSKANVVCAAFVQDALLQYWQRVHVDNEGSPGLNLSAEPVKIDQGEGANTLRESQADNIEEDYGLMPESHNENEVGIGAIEAQFSDADLAISEGLKKMVYMLSQSVTDVPHVGHDDLFTESQYTWSLERWQQYCSLPVSVEKSLLNIQSQEGIGMYCPTQAYTQLLIEHYSLLPGLRDLSIAACCRFGLPPPSPLLEKEYITELTLRYLHNYPQNATQPHGPDGTQWCVVSKEWYDAWRKYVGHTPHYSEFHPLRSGARESTDSSDEISAEVTKSSRTETETSVIDIDRSGSAITGTRGSSLGVSSYIRRGSYGIAPQRPPAIDNSIIMERNAKTTQLLPNLQLGVDIEVVPPAVFSALHAWYGGGPIIERSTICTENWCNTGGSSSAVPEAELELYPLCFKICTCDSQGKTILIPGAEREILFSRAGTVAMLITNLCLYRRIEESRVRLWNYAENDWKRQYILSPEVTLQSANIKSGQWILMEISLADGSWPRSQLHAAMDSEEKSQSELQPLDLKVSESQSRNNVVAFNGDATADNSLSAGSVFSINSGKVGMHNLGNTCYMNSSVQSLLHTEHFVHYFLSEQHLKHLNVRNIHGYKGRLALSFGKLVSELWSTHWNCITPKAFMQEVSLLRDQFAGNEQHDAHEMLAFLLDGLSEDLNLVHEKPYTEQPDSDGRPDAILADIWWSNHLKRDRSVVQALFTGQFKSVMTCTACNNYTSARFEPFNFLTVPIPEETTQVIVVSMIPLQLQHAVQCAVRVNKDGTLADIADKLIELNLAGTHCDYHSLPHTNTDGRKRPRIDADYVHLPLYFQVGELSNCRIKSFNSMDRKVETLRDTEHLVFFQIRRLPGENPSPNLSLDGANPVKLSQISTADKVCFPERLLTNPDASSLVRVAFSQRRIRICDNATGERHLQGGMFASNSKSNVNNGFEYYVLEPFGVSLLEVLPNRISCGDLYRIISHRLRPFLKAPVRKLIRHQLMQKQSRSSVSLTSHMSSYIQSHQTMYAQASNSKWHPIQSSGNMPSVSSSDFDATAPVAAADMPDVAIRSIGTDEVIAGAIPREGFTLRLINGGTGSGTACSRCHWLQHCQGCVLPDNNDVLVMLRDGESIAVDWHYVVYQDLLDLQSISHIKRHESVRDEQSSAFEIRTPLSDCLDKFTEQESLEDVVCPRCHDSDHMKRSFSLWRLPPVLIVQLKRFQFDRFSRRKLTNRIDFPFENLDLQKYLASSRHPKLNEEENGSASLKMHALYGSVEGLADVPVANGKRSDVIVSDGMECITYDLYSVIHHLGALGGGHYAATIRHPRYDSNGRLKVPQQQQHGIFSTFINGIGGIMEGDENNTSSQEPQVISGQSPDIPSTRFQSDDPWYIYNDNLVTEVINTSEISAPSAYVLFYMRQDVEYKSIMELLEGQLGNMYIKDNREVTTVNVVNSQPPAPVQSIRDDASNRKRSSTFEMSNSQHDIQSSVNTSVVNNKYQSDDCSGNGSTSTEISTLAAAAAAVAPNCSVAPHISGTSDVSMHPASNFEERRYRDDESGQISRDDVGPFQNDQPLNAGGSTTSKYRPHPNGPVQQVTESTEAEDGNCGVQ